LPAICDGVDDGDSNRLANHGGGEDATTVFRIGEIVDESAEVAKIFAFPDKPLKEQDYCHQYRQNEPKDGDGDYYGR
jgi:hypothetical protein